MAVVGSGFSQGGSALIAPSYRKYVHRNTISLADDTAQTFSRITGPHRIVMTWTPLVGIAKTWTFAITGGSNRASSQVLPMFPRPSEDVYNKTINYRINGNDLPPSGCDIITLPVPPASAMTSRINLFQVTETITGMNFSFVLAYCPFAEVDPTISFLGAPPDPDELEMKIVFYRLPADNYRAIAYPTSRGAPIYFVKNFPTSFTSVAGVNPLDAFNPLPFKRISGQQTILVVNTTTGFYFLFDVDYGIIGQGHGYIGYTFNPTANARLASTDVENATLTITSPTDYNAQQKVEQFTLTAGDGRTYIFTLDPGGNTQIPPTIQLVNPGPPLAAEDLIVNVLVRYFHTI